MKIIDKRVRGLYLSDLTEGAYFTFINNKEFNDGVYLMTEEGFVDVQSGIYYDRYDTDLEDEILEQLKVELHIVD